MAKQKHESLAAALSAFQANLPTVAKNATGQVGQNRNYKYADLKDISDAAYPKLAEHGLAFISKPQIHRETGKFVLAFSLLHESGQREDGEFELPAGSMQQLGSALTYAKRYSLCAVTGIVPGDDDDDGHAASQQWGQPTQQERSAPPQQRTNGQQQRPAPPAAAPEPTSADEARALLKAACADNKWDLGIVATRFKAVGNGDLKTTDDAAAIVKFRDGLFAVSDGELRKQPAANGAGR